MSTSATAGSRRSTLGSVPTTSTSNPGTPRPRISAGVRGGDDRADRLGELALVRAARAAEEVGVADVVALQEGEQLALVERKADGVQPRAQEPARVLGPEVRADRAAPGVALAHDALDHGEDRARVWPRLAVAAPERAHGERHRRVRPLGRAALVAVRGRAAGADVGQELLRSLGLGRLGERPPDVDAGVVVGPPDAGAAVGLDVDRRGCVELPRAGPVARLPDREELREAPAVARRERRLDGVERVREGAADLVVVQVAGDEVDVVRVRL